MPDPRDLIELVDLWRERATRRADAPEVDVELFGDNACADELETMLNSESTRAGVWVPLEANKHEHGYHKYDKRDPEQP